MKKDYQSAKAGLTRRSSGLVRYSLSLLIWSVRDLSIQVWQLRIHLLWNAVWLTIQLHHCYGLSYYSNALNGNVLPPKKLEGSLTHHSTWTFFHSFCLYILRNLDAILVQSSSFSSLAGEITVILPFNGPIIANEVNEIKD
jgi:hypothetical protein